MDEGDPEKLQEEVDAIEANVKTLDGSIVEYGAKNFGLLAKHCKEKREELVTQQKALQTKLEENVPLAKSLQGDQNRINHQHTQKMEKMKESYEEAKKRLEEAKQLEGQRQKEEKERHVKEMATIEELSEKAQKQIEEEIQKLKEKMEEEDAAYAQKKAQIGTELAKNQSKGVAEAFASTAASALEAEDIKPDKNNIAEFLKLKQADLEVPEQLQESQINTVAAMMEMLFEKMQKDLAKRIRKKITNKEEEESEEEQEAEEPDGYQKVLPGKKGARRAKNPDAMAIEPTGQQKRVMTEEAAYEDAQTKKSQAIEEVARVAKSDGIVGA